MNKLTFKEFLTELMVDVDPEMDATQQLVDVRKKQLLAKRAPEQVARQQSAEAKQQLATASRSTAPTAPLEAQIARMKDQLFKLQQKLEAQRKRDAATSNAPPTV